jgi:acetyl esterase/lipase
MTMHKQTLFVFCFLLSVLFVSAQKVIPLYSGKAPGSEKWNWQEKEISTFGMPVVYNVVDPTLTAYLPDPAIANGTAVIIAPGGGFHILSINSEGIDVAKWLNAKGVAAFVLKYRLVRSLTNDPMQELMQKLTGDHKAFDRENDSVVNMAIADGKRAMEYVRSHAEEYKIDSKRIGFMGFSAGGTVTMGVGLSYTAANRPDFLAPVYPYMGVFPEMDAPTDAPPLFVCAASDDQLGLASHSSNLYNVWIKAGKPAELHMYAKGGHGFGMRKQNLPVDTWIERFGDWLNFQGLLKPVTKQ